MNKRRRFIASGFSLGTAAAVFVAITYIALSTAGNSAMANIAVSIAEATSFVVDISTSSAKDDIEVHSKLYWKAPGATRREYEDRVSELGPQKSTDIHFKSKRGISIDHIAKTYRTSRAEVRSSPLMLIHKLGSYTGKATKELGERVIGDIECQGVEIPIQEIDPDAGSGVLKLWVRKDNSLPHECEFRIASGGETMVMKMQNFVWNSELDPALFEAKAPEGYVERKSSHSPDEMTQKIVLALRNYAKIDQGKYPQVKIPYGDVTRDTMMEIAGFYGKELTTDITRTDEYVWIVEAGLGFAHINTIMRHDAKAEYHGLTVTSNHKDEVLFRWQRDDGKFQIIYGDLSTETESLPW